MSWSLKRALGNIGKGIAAPFKGENYGKLWGGTKKLGGALWGGAKDAVSYVKENPIRVLKAGHAILTSVPPLTYADPLAWTDPAAKLGKNLLVYQGVLRGGAGIVGMGASLTKVTLNGVHHLGHDPVNGEWEKPFTGDWAKWWMDQTDKTGIIQTIEQVNLVKYGTAELTEDQKAILYGAQGVTEIGAFVLAGGGVGLVAGAATNGTRIAFYAARGATALTKEGAKVTIRSGARTGMRIGASAMNPVHFEKAATLPKWLKKNPLNVAGTGLDVISVPMVMTAEIKEYDKEKTDEATNERTNICLEEMAKGNLEAPECVALDVSEDFAAAVPQQDKNSIIIPRYAIRGLPKNEPSALDHTNHTAAFTGAAAIENTSEYTVELDPDYTHDNALN